jgi:calcineurin-like phosphoesterase family protein
MATWFTSDTHYDHANIIRYCSRPYADVREMNRAMLDNWNARVGVGDTVYHLGDFHMGNRNRIREFRARLNGRIVLVRGNHDRSAEYMRESGFDEVADETRLGDVYMRHKPIDFTEPWPDGARVMLCGHVHGAWSEKRWVERPEVHMIIVGVDVRGMRPVSLEELGATL